MSFPCRPHLRNAACGRPVVRINTELFRVAGAIRWRHGRDIIVRREGDTFYSWFRPP